MYQDFYYLQFFMGTTYVSLQDITNVIQVMLQSSVLF